MKKILIMLLVIALVFTLTGCGVKDNIEKKVGEKITETIIEKAVGDENTKVDIDGETITIKGADGGEVSLGGTKWPEVDYLPEFKAGDIISAAKDGDGNVMIILEKVEKKDYENYVKAIQKDFTEDVAQMETEEFTLFEGRNGKGNVVALQYFHQDKTFTIIGKKENQ